MSDWGCYVVLCLTRTVTLYLLNIHQQCKQQKTRKPCEQLSHCWCISLPWFFSICGEEYAHVTHFAFTIYIYAFVRMWTSICYHYSIESSSIPIMIPIIPYAKHQRCWLVANSIQLKLSASYSNAVFFTSVCTNSLQSHLCFECLIRLSTALSLPWSKQWQLKTKIW